MSSKLSIGLAVGVGIVGALSWYVLGSVSDPVSQERTPDEVVVPAATSTDAQSTPSPKPVANPEPVFVLPAGATMVDEFSFKKGDEVYFKSLTSVDPLPVPGADPASFERVTEVMEYTLGDVIRDCGAAPRYAFYRDEDRLYFYHYWRTPTFRGSHIDILMGLTPEKFVQQSPTQVKVGGETFSLVYAKTGQTCRMKITGSTLNN